MNATTTNKSFRKRKTTPSSSGSETPILILKLILKRVRASVVHAPSGPANKNGHVALAAFARRCPGRLAARLLRKVASTLAGEFEGR